MVSSKLKQLSCFHYLIPKEGNMRVEPEVYISDDIVYEEQAIQQLIDASCVPGVEKVIGTPDIHTGFGVPIGSVVAMKDRIIPAAVGYDINCGMRVLLSNLKISQVPIQEVAVAISRRIPLGEGKKNISLTQKEMKDVLEKGVASLEVIGRKNSILSQFYNKQQFKIDIERIEDYGSLKGDASCVSPRAIERGISQIGTLGGGNHFIELQEVIEIYNQNIADEFGLFKGQFVIMIHSGSRGLGHQIADEYMKKAAKLTLHECPNRELCYLPLDSHVGTSYLKAMHCGANFAYVNRAVMTMIIRFVVEEILGKKGRLKLLYDVTHNIAKKENHEGKELIVHRKGATRAFPADLMVNTPFSQTGQPVLIPGSMGSASYILVGTPKSKESLYSVNHGAGRTMSRRAAAGKKGRKGLISDREFKESMKGIFLICNDRAAIKEEAPAAYKDIDKVIRVVKEAGLAEVVAKMRPLAVLKG